MLRYTLHVPVADNDGRGLSALHAYVRDRLVSAYGGETHIMARGGYRGAREMYAAESMTLYVVDDIGSPDDPCEPALLALAEYVKREAAQEAVYLTRHAIDVWIV